MAGEYESSDKTILPVDQKITKPSDIMLGKRKAMDDLATQMHSLNLAHGLDLTKHPLHESLAFQKPQNIMNISDFRNTINDDRDGPRYLKSIAQIVDYDISTHEKTSEEFASLQKTIRTYQQKEAKSAKELSNAMQKLIKSEEGYTMKVVKCTRLQEELDTTTTQLNNARAHQEVDSQIQNELAKAPAQRVDHAKDLRKLDAAQVKIIQLRKQLVKARKTNEGGATMLFDEVEYYMGLHLISAEAKRELNKITMKHTKSVNEFYHRIFELWEDAETPKDKHIEQFETMLKSAISQPLLDYMFTNMRIFLNAAWKIKDKKLIIMNNFLKQWQEKSNLSKNSRSWNCRFGGSTGVSSTIRDGGSASSGGLLAAKRGSSNAQDTTNINAKFIPTSIKPVGWSGA
ncbi:hypothetical protein MMC22_011433 [Lobaria immixta]|nr:hypothetical protein [Lobaria immixta]